MRRPFQKLIASGSGVAATHATGSFSSLLVAAARLASISVLKMPALSPTMETGGLAEWHKVVGDAVQPGDVLCHIETDKATVAFENAGEEGFVARILVAAGTKSVPLGQPIALLVDKAADIRSSDVAAWKDSAIPAAAPAARAPAAPAAAAPAAAPSPLDRKNGPAADFLIGQLPPDARSRLPAAGSGKNGRLTKEDVLRATGAGSTAQAARTKEPAATAPPNAVSSRPATSRRVVPGVVENFSIRDAAVLQKLLGRVSVAKKM